MNAVIKADLRRTIIELVNKGNASSAGRALFMVEILNAVYKKVNVRTKSDNNPK